ncbi:MULTISPECIES: dihydrolipoamide acetyltransferase family protein [unclassified Arthrobacter]|uniref:dihydrolipoamide acetyltransferase family protein n=1 Tax=unclassified Arthrobacter TaxID=235627 RepID=UPI00298F0ED5|nr:dihydrolipoamide acetyltransferase family protein [Arthrobacter sp. AET 35A]
MSATTASAAAPGTQLKVFNLPDLGEGLTEAELVNWLVAEGDVVVVDQAIAEVETAKSVVEVPSPFAGVVEKLHGRAGETIDVGKPLISVRPAGQSGVTVPTAAEETYREEERAGITPPQNREPVAAPAPDEGSGNVLIGYGTPGGLASGRRRRPKYQSAARPAGSEPTAVAASAAADEAPARQAPLFISPLVRKLARDAGLRASDLTGSGPDGMVLRRDVEQHLSRSAAQPTSDDGASTALPIPADTAPAGPAAEAVTDRKSGLGISTRTPVKGVRKTVADNMARSRREIPEATVWVDVDATALMDLRASLKRTNPDSTPGLLAFVARFVTAGLAKYPELNTRIVTDETGGQEILGFDGVNLGIAAQTPRGLMVPCVQRADTLSARGLDAEIRRLTAVVREGKATPAELTSGTFTLNNYGVFGVDGSAAIINHPEAAILGIGRIIDRPWVVRGELAVRKITELTLTFDHRVCDGGVAGGFLRYVADAIENPGTVLADL